MVPATSRFAQERAGGHRIQAPWRSDDRPGRAGCRDPNVALIWYIECDIEYICYVVYIT